MTPLDLATSEETHLFVEESGKTSKKGTLNGKEKAEVSEPKTSLEDINQSILVVKLLLGSMKNK